MVNPRPRFRGEYRRQCGPGRQAPPRSSAARTVCPRSGFRHYLGISEVEFDDLLADPDTSSVPTWTAPLGFTFVDGDYRSAPGRRAPVDQFGIMYVRGDLRAGDTRSRV
jgi:hypothetical protein